MEMNYRAYAPPMGMGESMGLDMLRGKDSRNVARRTIDTDKSIQKFKTRICQYFMQGYCPYAERCLYAHGDYERRIAAGDSNGTTRENPRYKTRLCKWWENSTGSERSCPHGPRCSYAHGEEERDYYIALQGADLLNGGPFDAPQQFGAPSFGAPHIMPPLGAQDPRVISMQASYGPPRSQADFAASPADASSVSSGRLPSPLSGGSTGTLGMASLLLGGGSSSGGLALIMPPGAEFNGRDSSSPPAPAADPLPPPPQQHARHRTPDEELDERLQSLHITFDGPLSSAPAKRWDAAPAWPPPQQPPQLMQQQQQAMQHQHQLQHQHQMQHQQQLQQQQQQLQQHYRRSHVEESWDYQQAGLGAHRSSSVGDPTRGVASDIAASLARLPPDYAFLPPRPGQRSAPPGGMSGSPSMQPQGPLPSRPLVDPSIVPALRTLSPGELGRYLNRQAQRHQAEEGAGLVPHGLRPLPQGPGASNWPAPRGSLSPSAAALGHQLPYGGGMGDPALSGMPDPSPGALGADGSYRHFQQQPGSLPPAGLQQQQLWHQQRQKQLSLQAQLLHDHKVATAAQQAQAQQMLMQGHRMEQQHHHMQQQVQQQAQAQMQGHKMAQQQHHYQLHALGLEPHHLILPQGPDFGYSGSLISPMTHTGSTFSSETYPSQPEHHDGSSAGGAGGRFAGGLDGSPMTGAGSESTAQTPTAALTAAAVAPPTEQAVLSAFRGEGGAYADLLEQQ